MSRLHPTSRPPVHASSPAVTLLVAVAACALAGCGAMPTAPVTASAQLTPGPSTTASAPVLMPADPGDAGASGAGSAATLGDVLAGDAATSILTGFALHATTRPVTTQGADITAQGGSVANGRWRVEVPAQAFASPVHVSLSVAGARGAACQLQFDPATASASVPLTLTFSCRGEASNLSAGWTLLAYDASSARWIPVPGSHADKKTHTISATIGATGIYGVGSTSGTPAW